MMNDMDINQWRRLILIHVPDGTVWTLGSLDYEKKSLYKMTVMAYDHGIPRRSSTTRLWIHVTDENDFLPLFTKSVYSVEIAENANINDVIYTLDASGQFTYEITGMLQIIFCPSNFIG